MHHPPTPKHTLLRYESLNNQCGLSVQMVWQLLDQWLQMPDLNEAGNFGVETEQCHFGVDDKYQVLWLLLPSTEKT